MTPEQIADALLENRMSMFPPHSGLRLDARTMIVDGIERALAESDAQTIPNPD